MIVFDNDECLNILIVETELKNSDGKNDGDLPFLETICTRPEKWRCPLTRQSQKSLRFRLPLLPYKLLPTHPIH